MTAGPHIPRLVFVAVLAALVLAGPADAAVLGEELGYLGCTSNDGSGGTCVDGTTLDDAYRIAASPDGKHVYVAAHFSGIAVFARSLHGHPDPDQLQRRRTLLASRVREHATTGGEPRRNERLRTDFSIDAYSRNADTGALTLIQCVTKERGGGAQRPRRHVRLRDRHQR